MRWCRGLRWGSNRRRSTITEKMIRLVAYRMQSCDSPIIFYLSFVSNISVSCDGISILVRFFKFKPLQFFF